MSEPPGGRESEPGPSGRGSGKRHDGSPSGAHADALIVPHGWHLEDRRGDLRYGTSLAS